MSFTLPTIWTSWFLKLHVNATSCLNSSKKPLLFSWTKCSFLEGWKSSRSIGDYDVRTHVQVCGYCNAGHQEASRCCTKGESEESMGHRKENLQASTVFWNPGHTSPVVQNRTYILKKIIIKMTLEISMDPDLSMTQQSTFTNGERMS